MLKEQTIVQCLPFHLGRTSLIDIMYTLQGKCVQKLMILENYVFSKISSHPKAVISLKNCPLKI